MNRPPYSGRIGRTELVKAPGWAVAVGAIVAGALGIAIFLASASIILILTPFVIGAAFYVRWRVKRALRKMAEAQGASRSHEHVDVIDGEYRIIDNETDRLRR